MDKPKIFIDAGHGGTDAGTSCKEFLEKDMNLKISLLMAKRFRELGFIVQETRTDDTYSRLQDRCKIIKTSGAKLCISNHINWTNNEAVKGAETIHSVFSSGKLANMILDNLEGAGAKKRRVFFRASEKYIGQDYYAIHRLTGRVESIIVEYGFASNEEDVKDILNNYKAYVEAVLRAVCNYLGLEYLKPREEEINYKELYEKAIKKLERIGEICKEK